MKKFAACRQDGYALLLISIVLLTMVSLYAVRASAVISDSSRQTRQRTANAMQEAKWAIIGYAAIEDNTPGSAICPDNAGNNGISDSCDSVMPQQTGCVPWSTLGLQDEYDGSGNRLWYILSTDWRNSGLSAADRTPNDEAAGKAYRPINPANTGSLNLIDLSGTTPVVAAIISAGQALPGQTRTKGIECTSFNISNYLERENAARGGNIRSDVTTSTFNDVTVTIRRNEMLRPILARLLNQFGGLNGYLQTNYNGAGKSFTDFQLEVSGTTLRPAYVMNRAGDYANFDNTMFNTPATKTLALDASSGPAYCSRVAISSGGYTAVAPVSWLCYNGWYNYIAYTASATEARISLTLDGTEASALTCTRTMKPDTSTADVISCTKP